ncbi:DUF7344 domain-containing protein [Halosolutus gelatinilyticus]|uniref:DUF7344 domain-containing protein n=1 Tax=Halosolutus gelatinilyticus TaxID=2931975 RepID=UPI001FF66327|nr:hypothetical protein [Halosolutus gelatinilyticus]
MTIHATRKRPDSDPSTDARHSSVLLRPLSREDIRRLLDSDRRREVLRCLLVAEEPIAVRTLVGRLADAEHDATAVTTLHELRQRIHVSLIRTHLPLLETHGIASYDRDCGLVSPGANLPAIGAVLDGGPIETPIATRRE